jgi:hypothetical protein
MYVVAILGEIWPKLKTINLKASRMYVVAILVLASIVQEEKKRWVWSPSVTLVFWSCPHPWALHCAKIDAKVKEGLYLFHKNTLLGGKKYYLL